MPSFSGVGGGGGGFCNFYVFIYKRSIYLCSSALANKIYTILQSIHITYIQTLQIFTICNIQNKYYILHKKIAQIQILEYFYKQTLYIILFSFLENYIVTFVYFLILKNYIC